MHEQRFENKSRFLYFKQIFHSTFDVHEVTLATNPNLLPRKERLCVLAEEFLDFRFYGFVWNIHNNLVKFTQSIDYKTWLK